MMAHLNAQFEVDGDCPGPEVWDEWLWGCDLMEALTVDSLLNRAHLLGLLIARVRATREPECMEVVVDLPSMAYQNMKLKAATPKQLRETIENLHAHWSMYVDEPRVDALTALVDGCLARLGCFLLWPAVYDDIEMEDPMNRGHMELLCVRRLIAILCVMYRHLDLMHRCVDPPCEGFCPQQIEAFNIESTKDEFDRLTMHAFLPPAARLVYRQNLPDHYHGISQVVYLHLPEYERSPQLDLDSVRSGEHPISTLAPISEMYPEINLCYEDDTLKPGAWNWVVMGQRVYLIDPARANVYYSPNLIRTMAAYVG